MEVTVKQPPVYPYKVDNGMATTDLAGKLEQVW